MYKLPSIIFLIALMAATGAPFPTPTAEAQVAVYTVAESVVIGEPIITVNGRRVTLAQARQLLTPEQYTRLQAEIQRLTAQQRARLEQSREIAEEAARNKLAEALRSNGSVNEFRDWGNNFVAAPSMIRNSSYVRVENEIVGYSSSGTVYRDFRSGRLFTVMTDSNGNTTTFENDSTTIPGRGPITNSRPVGDMDSVGVYNNVGAYGRYWNYDADAFGAPDTDYNTTCSYFRGWVLDRDNIDGRELNVRLVEVDTQGRDIRTVATSKVSAPLYLGTSPSAGNTTATYYWNWYNRKYFNAGGYTIPTPASLRDGRPHLVKIYVEDIDRQGNRVSYNTAQPMNDVTARNQYSSRTYGRTGWSGGDDNFGYITQLRPYIGWQNLWRSSNRQSAPYVGSASVPIFKVRCMPTRPLDVAVQRLYYVDVQTGQTAPGNVLIAGRQYRPYIVVRNNAAYTDDIRFDVTMYDVQRRGTLMNVPARTTRIVPLSPVVFGTRYVSLTTRYTQLSAISGVVSGRNNSFIRVGGVQFQLAESVLTNNIFANRFMVVRSQQMPQCSNLVDDSDPEDTRADMADKGCWTNNTYDPTDNDETDPATTATMNVNPNIVNPGQRYRVIWNTTNAASVRVTKNGAQFATTPTGNNQQTATRAEAGRTITYNVVAQRPSGGAPVQDSDTVRVRWACSDTVDNDGDRQTDREDPGCRRDPEDPTTYDPNDNDESNEGSTDPAQLGVAPDVSITADGKEDRTVTRSDRQILIEWDPNGYTTPSSPAANRAGINCTLQPADVFRAAGVTDAQMMRAGSARVTRSALTIFSYSCTSPDAIGQKAWQGGEDKSDTVEVEVIPEVFES